jgi:hypothetical protein
MTNSLFITTCICVTFFVTAADAQLGRPTESRPATTKDLAGKKICWNSGNWGLYGASGDYLDNRGRHPKWFIAEPGVVKIGVSYRQLEVLPDGTFMCTVSVVGVDLLRDIMNTGERSVTNLARYE